MSYRIELNNFKSIEEAMITVPDEVTTIDLSGNRLNDKTGDELVAMITALKEGVTSVDLSENCLNDKTDAELISIFESIPTTVTDINIDGNEFSTHQLQMIKKARFNAKIKNLSHQVNELLTLGASRSVDYDFSTIRLPFEINEGNLSQVIGQLESQKSPASSITASMILFGEIKSTCEIYRSPEQEAAYYAKRISDAIRLLYKTAQTFPAYAAAISHIAKTFQMRLAPSAIHYKQLSLLAPKLESGSTNASIYQLYPCSLVMHAFEHH